MYSGSRAATNTNNGRIADTDFVYTMTITTKHKPYLSKDRNLLKMVTEMTLRGAKADVVDDLLQRHFVELTDRFLQPLNRYFDGLLVGSPLDMYVASLIFENIDLQKVAKGTCPTSEANRKSTPFVKKHFSKISKHHFQHSQSLQNVP
jgi:hypothetical protein